MKTKLDIIWFEGIHISSDVVLDVASWPLHRNHDILSPSDVLDTYFSTSIEKPTQGFVSNISKNFTTKDCCLCFINKRNPWKENTFIFCVPSHKFFSHGIAEKLSLQEAGCTRLQRTKIGSPGENGRRSFS